MSAPPNSVIVLILPVKRALILGVKRARPLENKRDSLGDSYALRDFYKHRSPCYSHEPTNLLPLPELSFENQSL